MLIKEYKFNTLEEILRRKLKSKEFKQSYEQELARLKIAKQIRTLRLKKKLTQKTLAEMIDMPQSVIARIESGTSGYSFSTLYRVAGVFGKEVRLV